VDQKLRGIRVKQPGAKRLLKKIYEELIFFKNSRQDMLTIFINTGILQSF
jgi:hypothetical protein